MFTVLRVAKIKSVGGLVACLSHDHRDRETPNADPGKKTRNETWLGGTAAQGLSKFRDLLGTVDRKIQSNAVRALEYVVSASPEFFEKPNGGREYLRKAHDMLVKKHGADRVVSSILHQDESTPHLHVVVVPLVKKRKKYTHKVTKETTTKEVVALDAGAFVGGAEKLRALQDEIGAVGAEFGLQRGVRGSKATHTEIAAWRGAKRLEAASGGVVADRPRETDPHEYQEDPLVLDALEAKAKQLDLAPSKGASSWDIASMIAQEVLVLDGREDDDLTTEVNIVLREASRDAQMRRIEAAEVPPRPKAPDFQHERGGRQ